MPPPCFNFSFLMIDEHRAMLFGGMQRSGERTNEAYVLDLSIMVRGKNNFNIISIDYFLFNKYTALV